MSTIDTSNWNPDADLNESIEGIPLNADASITQTWQVIRILMAAFKGDTSAIEAMMVPFSGATASADGVSGFVPAPEAGDQNKVLKGDGTWSALDASQIPVLDASKIASGTIDIARLPAGALERLVTVADQTARYALTTASVQLGDTVKQLDTGLLYFVTDTAHLDSESGYEIYTAGAATAVPWSGITDKPSTFPPSSHTHGSITNDGKLGTASRVVQTDTNGAIDVSSVTATELGYLSGVTSAVQTQLDGKLSTSGTAANASKADILNSSSPSSDVKFCYTSGTLPIGTNAGNIFKGTSSDPKLVSAPENGTAFTATIANVQNIRCSYSAVYFSDIFLSPNNHYIWHRDVTNGSAKSWRRLVEEDVSDFNPPAWNISIASSSDERLKTNTSAIADDVLDAWESVGWGQFQYASAVEEKGEAARLHLGLIAQRVKATFEKRGLDACKYGILCLNAEGFWSIRYAEALAMEAACQRRRADRLEARIAALEEKINA